MRVIKLKPNGAGRYEDISPFIITDKKLELKINLPTVKGDFYFIYRNNCIEGKRLIPCNGEINIDNLTAGELRAAVRHYFKGELIKEYSIESLILIEATSGISAEPEIAALRRETSTLSKIIAKKQSEDLQRDIQLESLQKNILALLRFAYEDFSVNAFLKGGSFESFIKEYGFILDETTIKTIKGEKENG